MKKMREICVASLAMLLVFVASGCGENNALPEGSSGENNDSPNPQELVIKQQKLPEKLAGYTEVSSYVGDVDGDGSDEKLVLSTSAERDTNGEFLWNDGQNWALYVTDKENGDYIFLDRFVQAGNVYFEVSDYYMEEGAQPRISVIVSTGAGFSVKTYSYSNDKQGYEETNIYTTDEVTVGGINRRFTSIPDIIK